MKKFVILLCCLLIFPCVGCNAYANSAFDHQVSSFLTKLTVANLRIRDGLTREMIYDYTTDTTNSRIIISPKSSVMLILYCDENLKKIKDIAVVYFTTDSDENQFQLKKTKSIPNETLFRNMCLQTIYALNLGIPRTRAKNIMREIGTFDMYTDGKQRSFHLSSYEYIMKLSRDGMLIMTISPI